MTERAHRQRGNRRSGEQGYALLTLLFVMAAIAVSMALSLPRIAMQSQRVREERLIYRGKEYQRAVQLYFRKQKKYPSSLDDLEETNGVRFLRRRYKDPITGEDEWRLVHMGNDGRFSDSLIHDTEEEEEEDADLASRNRGGIQPSAPIGSQAAMATQEGFYSPDGRFRGADRARVVRQSAAPTIPGQTSPGGQAPEGAPTQGSQAYSPYGVPLQGTDQNAAGQPQQQPAPGQYPGYSRMRPSQIPRQAQQPTANSRNAGGVGFLPSGSSFGANSTGRPGSAPFGGTAAGSGMAQNRPTAPPAALGAQGVGADASNIIRNLLTRPRPGGLAGLRGGQAASAQSAFTGGIAGVATTAEERGVKVYEGYEFYNQWEFIYDYRSDPSLGGAAVGPQAGAGQGMRAGQPGLSSSGTLSATPQGVPGTGVQTMPGAQPGATYPAAYPGHQPADPRSDRRRDSRSNRNRRRGMTPFDPTRPTPAAGQPPIPGLPQQPGQTPPTQPGNARPNVNPFFGQPGNNQQTPNTLPPGLMPGVTPQPGQPGYRPPVYTQPQSNRRSNRR